MKNLFLITALFYSSISLGSSVVEGTIKEIFVSENGAIALILSEGIPQETKTLECPSANGYAGNRASAPLMNSALLAAYTAKKKVKLCLTGCDGSWIKVTCVLVKD